MELRYPEEPLKTTLRNSSDWSEGIFSEIDKDEIRGDRVSERQVPSYLWEQWKRTLEQHGYIWQQFQSELSEATMEIQDWGNEDIEWEQVIDRIEDVLDAEIEG